MIGLLTGVFGFMFAIVAIASFISRVRYNNYTGETTGTVTNVDCDKKTEYVKDDDGHTHTEVVREYTIYYTYDIDGKNYSNHSQKYNSDHGLHVRDEVTVYYVPDDYEKSCLGFEKPSKKNIIGWTIAAVIALGFTFVYFVAEKIIMAM